MTLISIKMVSVMGVTWLLGVAANFKVLWFMWYPFVVLNSLQGKLRQKSKAPTLEISKCLFLRYVHLFGRLLKKTRCAKTVLNCINGGCDRLAIIL